MGKDDAIKRCRELFDVQALIQALAAELSSFNEKSPRDSISQLFLVWASENLKHKHIVFDETCMHVDIGYTFVTAILEVLFLGKPSASIEGESYRGHKIGELFILKGEFNLQRKDAPLRITRFTHGLSPFNFLFNLLLRVCRWSWKAVPLEAE